MAADESTSGVQELIDRLSHEGVAEGEARAEQIIAEAHRKAGDILDEARRDADKILKKAREEAEHFRTGGEEAVQLACRDAQRDLASRLHDGFRNRLQELVQYQLQDAKLLKQMILEITRKAKPAEADADADVVVLLPPAAIQEESVRQRIQDGDEDALTEFVKELIGEEVRSGFDVKLGDADQTGLRVQVVGENVEIDFTDQAIAQLLAQHLLPRFRAILRR
jgi:V/A-type H+-transporting ATPase subunit E